MTALLVLAAASVIGNACALAQTMILWSRYADALDELAAADRRREIDQDRVDVCWRLVEESRVREDELRRERDELVREVSA